MNHLEMNYQRVTPIKQPVSEDTLFFPALTDAPWERMAIEYLEIVNAETNVMTRVIPDDVIVDQ